MNVTADRSFVLQNENIRDDISNSAKPVPSARTHDLNIQTLGPISLLPYGQRCGIRFELDSTVTIILGMKSYRHAHVSRYFASLVATWLGIPFKQIRVYYSGAHPAVRISPMAAACVPSNGNVGATNVQIGALVQSLCEQVIEHGRCRLGALCGALPDEIEFDAATGQFLVASKEQRVDILELARWARR